MHFEIVFQSFSNILVGHLVDVQELLNFLGVSEETLLLPTALRIAQLLPLDQVEPICLHVQVQLLHVCPLQVLVPMGELNILLQPATVNTPRVQPLQLGSTLGLFSRFRCHEHVVAAVLLFLVQFGREEPGRVVFFEVDLLVFQGLVTLSREGVPLEVEEKSCFLQSVAHNGVVGVLQCVVLNESAEGLPDFLPNGLVVRVESEVDSVEDGGEGVSAFVFPGVLSGQMFVEQEGAVGTHVLLEVEQFRNHDLQTLLPSALHLVGLNRTTLTFLGWIAANRSVELRTRSGIR